MLVAETGLVLRPVDGVDMALGDGTTLLTMFRLFELTRGISLA